MPVKSLKPHTPSSQKKKVLPIIQLGSNGGRKGYRYDIYGGRYSPLRGFYEIFYEKISNHYIILEEWKDMSKRDTWPLEVYELEKSERSLEQRCLFLLREKLVGWNLPREKVYGAKIVRAND